MVGECVAADSSRFSRRKCSEKWGTRSLLPRLIGVRALAAVAPKGQAFDLSFQGHTLHVTPAGTVQTGAAEDSRIYISLADFVAWTGVQPSTIEVAASGISRRSGRNHEPVDAGDSGG